MEIERNARTAHHLVHGAAPGLALIAGMQRRGFGKTLDAVAPDLQRRMSGDIFEEFDAFGVVYREAAHEGNIDVARGLRTELFQKSRFEGQPVHLGPKAAL